MGGSGQLGWRAWSRVQALIRSSAQAQLSGSFRIRFAGVPDESGRDGEEPEPKGLRLGGREFAVKGEVA